MDVAMTENSKRERVWRERVVYNINLWFDQENAFLKLFRKGASADRVVNNSRVFAFVQYFDVVGSKYVSFDAVEKASGCAGLCCARGDFDGELAPRKYFVFCPLGSLKRPFPVVEVSNELNRMNGKLKTLMEFESVHGKERLDAGEWDREVFHVNTLHT